MSPICTLLLMAVTLAAVPGARAADDPAAYSHVIPVTVSGKQGVVQLPVPREVYLQARSGDLRDLRLFDAGGTPMPFALVERVREDQLARSWAPAAVFAVSAATGAPAGAAQGLQIRTRTDGTLVSVGNAAADGGAEVLASLILDLHQPGQPENGSVAVAALEPEMAPGAGSYSARVTVEASDDLQHWTTITEASLSWLANAQGARVQKNRIAFAPRAFRYARIAWLEGKPVEFAGVTAEYVTEMRAPEPWDSIVLQPAPGASGDDLLYAAPPAIPVESVGLVFQEHNVVLPALLGQYRTPPGRQGMDRPAHLSPVAGATFFQLTQNGQRRTSGDIEVTPTHASQWVLRPQAKLAERPALRLRWKPEIIVFVAGGNGPYTLAFGRDGVQPAALPLEQVAPGFSRRELAGLETAKAGTPLRQHAPDAGLVGGVPGRTVWLWGLLLCGVAALAFMAWRLIRQMKEEPPGPPSA